MVESGKPHSMVLQFWTHKHTLQKLETTGELVSYYLCSSVVSSYTLFFTCPVHCMASCCEVMCV